MILGLSVHAGAACAGLFARSFASILVVQAISAFGAAAGSVVTQTMLRDRWSGPSLAAVFSLATMVLAASPAIGLCLGTAIVHGFGYAGVMACLSALAIALAITCAVALPETAQPGRAGAPLRETLAALVRDGAVWTSAMRVALFNIALLSYYQLAPFMFERLHAGTALYGATGLLMAIGAVAGGWLNRRTAACKRHDDKILPIAAVAMSAAGVAVHTLDGSRWFFAPMTIVVLAFGVAIPRILGDALARHRDRLGTAGACFGLMYYLMIGAGMAIVGSLQSLGGTLIACGVGLLCLPLAGVAVAVRRMLPGASA